MQDLIRDVFRDTFSVWLGSSIERYLRYGRFPGEDRPGLPVVKPRL